MIKNYSLSNDNNYRLIVTLELKENTKNKPVFSASAYLKEYGTQLELGGQCLDTIWNEFNHIIRNKDLYKQIMDLWQKYHLNDLNADCEHAINEALAKKDLTIYHYSFKGDFTKLENKLKLIKNNKILSENIKLNKLCKTYLKYGYAFKSEFSFKQLPKSIKRLYKLRETEVKTAGWVTYNEALTPSGILSKPCPICSYKYGTAWCYRAIPTKDLKLIKKLIKGV